jgi:hypothetical protein
MPPPFSNSNAVGKTSVAKKNLRSLSYRIIVVTTPISNRRNCTPPRYCRLSSPLGPSHDARTRSRRLAPYSQAMLHPRPCRALHLLPHPTHTTASIPHPIAAWPTNSDGVRDIGSGEGATSHGVGCGLGDGAPHRAPLGGGPQHLLGWASSLPLQRLRQGGLDPLPVLLVDLP